MIKLTAIFEPCEEGGFHASIPEFPGVHSQGQTIQEASDNLVDALREIVAYRIEEKIAQDPNAVSFEVALN